MSKNKYINLIKKNFDFSNPKQINIKRQKELFGFSIFIFYKNNIHKAIKLGILNSNNIIKKHQNIFSIPHTYLFGGIFIGIILLGLYNYINFGGLLNSSEGINNEIIYDTNPYNNYSDFLYGNNIIWNIKELFLVIIISILLFTYIIPIIKEINLKIDLFKKNRILFNIEEPEIKKIKNDYFSTKKKNGYFEDYFIVKLLSFLFGQPFIFVHLQESTYQSFFSILLYDFIIFIILFGILDKIVFYILILFYYIYFYILDIFPFLFSKRDKKYDMYYDLNKILINIIKYVDIYKLNIKNLRNSQIDKNFGINIENLFKEINSLYIIIKKINNSNTNYSIFIQFMNNFIKELIDIYKKGLIKIVNHIKLINKNNKNKDMDIFFKIIANKDDKIKKLDNIIIQLDLMKNNIK